jgi:dTMP kinase
MAGGSLLRRRGYRDLVIGQAVSSFGDWMGTVALMALVLDLTGSATAVGVILVLRLLPAGFAGPIAAGVAERWDRRRIMLACDLLRAVLVALIPLVRAAWWVYLWAFLLEVANLVFLPARDASIPDLVDEDELPSANGIILGSSYGNIPVGAGAFALLTLIPTGWSGYLESHQGALALWLDGATYLVSYVFIRRLAVLGPSRAPAGGRRGDGVARGAWAGVVAAVRLPIVRAVLPATVTAVIGVGALFSLGVVFVREVLHASTGQFGVMVALFGVGGVAGWAWLQRQRGGPTLATIRLAAAAMGVILAIMSLLSTISLAYLAAVPFGAAGASALVASITYLQETLSGPDRLLGLAVYHIVFRVGLSVAAIGGGLAAQALGPTRLPLLGTLEPSALVLLCAGVVMVLGAALMPTSVAARPDGHAAAARRPGDQAHAAAARRPGDQAETPARGRRHHGREAAG